MRVIYVLICAIFVAGAFLACGPSQEQDLPVIRTRDESIPARVVKVSQSADAHPPILHADEFGQPAPLASAVAR